MAGLLAVLLSESSARAEPSSIGAASNALPGIQHVGVAKTSAPTLSATLGYGLTEAQTAGDESHHRASFRAAAAAAPIPWLALAWSLDARYDTTRDDSGAVVDTGLTTRLAPDFGALALGLELGVRAPGSEKVSTTLEALTFDARALAGYDAGSVVVASHLGYRFDRSAAVGRDAARFGLGDRVALGASDFDALLAGVGAIVRAGRTEILIDASADILVGSGAPSLTKSPLRLSAGVRQPLTRRLSLEVSLSGSPSGRTGIDAADPLVPIEPRFAAFAGLRYQFATEPAAAAGRRLEPEKSPAPVKAAPVPSVAAPPESVLELTLTDDLGNPLPGARVTLEIAGKATELLGGEGGQYRAEHLPVGKGTLALTAERFEPARREIELVANEALRLRLALVALPPPSQVRGVIRTFGGRGVAAKVRVEPLGLEATADGDGAFQVDVPPGDYEVVIQAQGFRSQRRKVRVEKSGVVILNAELVKQ